MKMRIDKRGVNRGELYLTPPKFVREIFKEENISIHFGSYGRKFDDKAGRNIVACYSHSIEMGHVEALGLQIDPILEFFVVKEKDIDEEIVKIFNDQELKKIYLFHQSLKKNIYKYGIYRMLIELKNHKFYEHYKD